MRERRGNYRLEYSCHEGEHDLQRIVVQGSDQEFVTLTEMLDMLVTPWLKACGYQFHELVAIIEEEGTCPCTPGTAMDASETSTSSEE